MRVGLRYALLVLLPAISLAVLQTSPWHPDNAPCARAPDEHGHEVAKVCACSGVFPQCAYTLLAVEVFMLLFSASYDLRGQKYIYTYRFTVFMLVFYGPLVMTTLVVTLLSDVECGALLWTWTLVAFVLRTLSIVVLFQDHATGGATPKKETPNKGNELFETLGQPTRS